jgi:hypothetical protein
MECHSPCDDGNADGVGVVLVAKNPDEDGEVLNAAQSECRCQQQPHKVGGVSQPQAPNPAAVSSSQDTECSAAPTYLPTCTQ